MSAAANAIPLTYSQRLARYIQSARFKDIDAAAVERTKHVIAYHVALACRGIREHEPDSQQALGVVRELNEGQGSSTLIGLPYRAPLADAAFVNCTLMRSFGLDDVIFPAGIHPGLVTVPVALTLGERLHSSGAEVLNAIVIGYEILAKFGKWTWSAETPRRATMPFGAFGAVTVAARLLGLTEEQTSVALGYAAHTAMGVAEGDAGPITHFYSMVCRNGIMGAYLARDGAWASPTTLEGRFGFIETFLGDTRVDIEELIASLGRNYAIMTSHEKRYPGTALNHVPIELMRTLVHQQRLRAADVAEIRIELPSERRNFAASHSTGPFPQRINAVASLPFQLGMLLLDGDLVYSRYGELTNPTLLGIARKCRCEFLEGRSIRYARLRVRTVDGREFVTEGERFSYEPEPAHVMLERDATGVLPPQQIENFLALLARLEHLEDVGELLHSLVPRDDRGQR
jgi:2-methylcitrate dehydratase PrpD